MPTTTLSQLIGAVSQCQMVVASDGGALHIAAALGVPSAVLFENRADKLERWYPWGVEHMIVHGEREPVADIAVDAVLSACRKLVGRSNRHLLRATS